MSVHRVIECEEWAPPYIKPKPVYDDGTPIDSKTGMSLSTEWLLPFIYGIMIGFGICLTIF